MMTARFGRYSHVEEARDAIAQNPTPPLEEMLTYREAAEKYQNEFRRIGLGAELPQIVTVLKNIAAKGALRRWDVAGKVRVAPVDIETYLRIAGQARPIA